MDCKIEIQASLEAAITAIEIEQIPITKRYSVIKLVSVLLYWVNIAGLALICFVIEQGRVSELEGDIMQGGEGREP